MAKPSVQDNFLGEVKKIVRILLETTLRGIMKHICEKIRCGYILREA